MVITATPTLDMFIDNCRRLLVVSAMIGMDRRGDAGWCPCWSLGHSSLKVKVYVLQVTVSASIVT